jgi:hypothetical protein
MCACRVGEGVPDGTGLAGNLSSRSGLTLIHSGYYIAGYAMSGNRRFP